MFYSTAVAYILWVLGGFGVLGLHRFYLRKFPTGILWLCTGGLGFVGAVYDFLTLGNQVREANIKAGYRYAVAGPTVVIHEHRDEPGRRDDRAKDSVEKIALRIAQRNGGVVSPGEIALDSDFTTDQARTALEKMTSQGLCEMRVRPSGVIVFRFPEFARDDIGFEPGL